MTNSSKEGLLSHSKRWSRIELSLEGFVFLKVSGDSPICSPDLTFNGKNCLYHMCIHKPHLTINRKVHDL